MFVYKWTLVLVICALYTQQSLAQSAALSKEAISLRAMLQASLLQNRHLQAQNKHLKQIWSGIERMCTAITENTKCNCEAPTTNPAPAQTTPSSKDSQTEKKMRDQPPPSVEFYRHDNGKIINSALFNDMKAKAASFLERRRKQAALLKHQMYTVSPSPIAEVLKDLAIAPYTDAPSLPIQTTPAPAPVHHHHPHNEMNLMHEMLGPHTHTDSNTGHSSTAGQENIRDVSLMPLPGSDKSAQNHVDASLVHHGHAPYESISDPITNMADHKHHLAEFDMINEVNGKRRVVEHITHSKSRMSDHGSNTHSVDHIGLGSVNNVAPTEQIKDSRMLPSGVIQEQPILIESAKQNSVMTSNNIIPGNAMMPDGVSQENAMMLDTITHVNAILPDMVSQANSIIPKNESPLKEMMSNSRSNMNEMVPNTGSHMNEMMPNSGTHISEMMHNSRSHEIGMPQGSVSQTNEMMPNSVTDHNPISGSHGNSMMTDHGNSGTQQTHGAHTEQNTNNIHDFDLFNEMNTHSVQNNIQALEPTGQTVPVADAGQTHSEPNILPNKVIDNKNILSDLLYATEQSIQEKQKVGDQSLQLSIVSKPDQDFKPKPRLLLDPSLFAPKTTSTTPMPTTTTETTTPQVKVEKYVKLAIKAVSSEGLVANTVTVTVRYSAPSHHTTEWLQLQSNGATTRTSGVRIQPVGIPESEYSSNMVFVDANATRHALFRLFGNNKSISIQFNLTELMLSGEQLLPDFIDDIIDFNDTINAQRNRDLVINLEVRGSPGENPALRHTEVFFTGLNTTTSPPTVFEIVHFNSEGVSVLLKPKQKQSSTMQITLKRPYTNFGGILTIRLPQTVGGYLAGYYYGHQIRVLEYFTQEVIPFGQLGVYYLPKRTLVRDPSQSILCAAMGNPPPNVVILKVAPDGKEKETLTETIMLDSVTNMKSLTLYADKPMASEGKYICRASIGSEVVDSSTEVVVVQPPEFDPVQTGITSNTSNRITISCKATAKPRPDLEMRLYEEHGPNLAKTGLYKTELLTPNNFTSQLTLTVSSNDREIHTVVCVAKQPIPDAKEHFKQVIVFPKSDDYTNWYLYNRLQSMATGW